MDAFNIYYKALQTYSILLEKGQVIDWIFHEVSYVLLGELLHVCNEIVNFIDTVIDVMVLCSVHIKQVYASLEYLIFFHTEFYVQKGDSVRVEAV